MDILSIFFNIKVCCEAILMSIHNIQFSILKKCPEIVLNLQV